MAFRPSLVLAFAVAVFIQIMFLYNICTAIKHKLLYAHEHDNLLSVG